MKKLVISSFGLGVTLVALGTGSPVTDDASSGIDLACKPRGTSCRTSFECCSQNCQAVNGVDACH